MSLLLLALIGASAAPAGDMPLINPKSAQSANCPATSRYEAARRGKTPRAQKLGDLPDADLYKAVYRRIGRCEAPIIVKYGVAGR
jgi:hypothetical protein